MLVGIEYGIGVDHGLADQVDHPPGSNVDHRRVERPGLHRVEDLLIGPSTGRGHLQVEARFQRCDPVGYGTPVADDEPAESPLASQDIGEQPAVLRRVHAVDPVVRAHHCPRLGVFDHALEPAQVDLPKRTRVDIRRDPHPVGFLIVGCKMLQRRPDAL